MGVYDGKTGKLARAQRYAHRGSFSDIGKNLNIIARRLMNNENLIKLLVHTDSKAESMDLTQEQIESTFGDQIRIVPVINKDEDVKNYVIIQFGAFTPVEANDGFYKQYIITFDVICNTANWMLSDYTPRPYKIMAEIDNVINKTKIESVGPVSFMGAQTLIVNEELSGFTLNYVVMAEQ